MDRLTFSKATLDELFVQPNFAQTAQQPQTLMSCKASAKFVADKYLEHANTGTVGYPTKVGSYANGFFSWHTSDFLLVEADDTMPKTTVKLIPFSGLSISGIVKQSPAHIEYVTDELVMLSNVTNRFVTRASAAKCLDPLNWDKKIILVEEAEIYNPSLVLKTLQTAKCRYVALTLTNSGENFVTILRSPYFCAVIEYLMLQGYTTLKASVELVIDHKGRPRKIVKITDNANYCVTFTSIDAWTEMSRQQLASTITEKVGKVGVVLFGGSDDRTFYIKQLNKAETFRNLVAKAYDTTYTHLLGGGYMWLYEKYSLDEIAASLEEYQRAMDNEVSEF